jgi:tryptophanase
MELRQSALRAAPELVAPEDFTTLKVVVDGDRDEALRRLREAGVTGDAEHVWIPVDLLRSLAGGAVNPAWEASMSGMVAYALARSWYDEQEAAVRAHIEYR